MPLLPVRPLTSHPLAFSLARKGLQSECFLRERLMENVLIFFILGDAKKRRRFFRQWNWAAEISSQKRRRRLMRLSSSRRSARVVYIVAGKLCYSNSAYFIIDEKSSFCLTNNVIPTTKWNEKESLFSSKIKANVCEGFQLRTKIENSISKKVPTLI